MTTETETSPLQRLGADILRLWALCAKPACRRAQQCRGNPRTCSRRYGRLVPEQARYGMLLMFEAARCGVSDEQMRADMPDEIAALEAWMAQVDAALDGCTAPETVDHGPELPPWA
jgi:hypothetical protein